MIKGAAALFPHTVQAARVYSVSPETAFNAWTDPALLERWFGPPDYRAEILTHDLYVGGAWRFRMIGANGDCSHHFGTFLEIDPPRRLVFTWASEELVEGWRDETGAPTRVTVEFFPRNGGVEVCVSHEQLQSAEARRALTGGWAGGLESLAVLLEGGRAR
ncbi:SRPBCC family protein [Pelagibius marinus]|uniref:SRPBCC family protein n=1 Tax=Pelagibius marinus TaxID=2762760 RepID=UPI001872E78C|nr:SRPBCC domain-containing protein [Pelagibius marinus]